MILVFQPHAVFFFSKIFGEIDFPRHVSPRDIQQGYLGNWDFFTMHRMTLT